MPMAVQDRDLLEAPSRVNEKQINDFANWSSTPATTVHVREPTVVRETFQAFDARQNVGQGYKIDASSVKVETSDVG